MRILSLTTKSLMGIVAKYSLCQAYVWERGKSNGLWTIIPVLKPSLTMNHLPWPRRQPRWGTAGHGGSNHHPVPSGPKLSRNVYYIGFCEQGPRRGRANGRERFGRSLGDGWIWLDNVGQCWTVGCWAIRYPPHQLFNHGHCFLIGAPVGWLSKHRPVIMANSFWEWWFDGQPPQKSRLCIE